VEDLVQEAFLKAYQGIASLKDTARFGPWLCQIGANLAVDWLRQQRRRRLIHQQHPTLHAARPAPRPDEQLDDGERAALLWQALGRLPPQHRQVVLLHHFEGCTIPGIARLTGLPLPTVKWRLSRARRRLRVELTGI